MALQNKPISLSKKCLEWLFIVLRTWKMERQRDYTFIVIFAFWIELQTTELSRSFEDTHSTMRIEIRILGFFTVHEGNLRLNCLVFFSRKLLWVVIKKILYIVKVCKCQSCGYEFWMISYKWITSIALRIWAKCDKQM